MKPCSEGFGNGTFEVWLREADSPDELLARIAAQFVLGGHKAAAVGSVMKRAAVYLVSDMPAETVSECGMRPFTRVDDAVGTALAEMGQSARIAVMPQGGSVLPAVAAG